MKHRTKIALALVAGTVVMQSTPADATTFNIQGTVDQVAYRYPPAAPYPQDFTINSPFSATYTMSNHLVEPDVECGGYLYTNSCYYIDQYSLTIGSRTFTKSSSVGLGGFVTTAGGFVIDVYTTIADPQYAYRPRKSHIYFYKNDGGLGFSVFGESVLDLYPPDGQFRFDGDPNGSRWFSGSISLSSFSVSSPTTVFEPSVILGLAAFSVLALTRKKLIYSREQGTDLKVY